MSLRHATLITAGLLGVDLSLAALEIPAAQTDADAGTVDTGDTRPRTATNSSSTEADAPSLYGQLLAAATALRGAPVSAAVGRPVSLEFIISLLRAANFDADRSAPAQWTLFLPVDAAFGSLDGRHLDVIHDTAALRALIDRHVLAKSLSLDTLKQRDTVTTIGGQALDVTSGDKTQVNGATVLAAKWVGSGRVFIVDGLL